jgi:phosphoribosylanthranilate isomerase
MNKKNILLFMLCIIISTKSSMAMLKDIRKVAVTAYNSIEEVRERMPMNELDVLQDNMELSNTKINMYKAAHTHRKVLQNPLSTRDQKIAAQQHFQNTCGDYREAHERWTATEKHQAQASYCTVS